MPDPTRGPGRLTPILLAATSLLALAPAARAATEGASVPVRSGRHPGFERLVLAWPTAVTPQMRQEDGPRGPRPAGRGAAPPGAVGPPGRARRGRRRPPPVGSGPDDPATRAFP